MPTIPVRNLGAVGLVTDIPPYDLPPNAWSVADNVRFDDNSVFRAPIFRRVLDLPKTPLHLFPKTPETGYDSAAIYYEDGSVVSYANGNLADALDVAVSPVTGRAPVTSAFLSQVEYLNKTNTVPLYRDPSMVDFDVLPNWDPTWRCRALRSFKDYLVALGITKNGIEHPTTVKWSDLALAGQVPGSWDATDPTKSAGETPLAKIKTSIVDGGELGDRFIIYARDQVWTMEESGNTLIFDFDRQFGSEAAIMSENCWVEIDGKHFVFGLSDIYIHDGVTKQSLVEGRVRKRIFSELNTKLGDNCFVAHNQNLNEVMFCYPSSKDNERFQATIGCNRALVYNYVADTLYFYDLPDVTAFTMINLDTVLSWAAAGSMKWSDIGGTWADQNDGFRTHPIFVAVGTDLSSSRILVLDRSERGEVALPFDVEAATQPRLERSGIDLDEVGFSLQGRRSVQSIFPQMSLEFRREDSELGIEFGFHDYPAASPDYSERRVFVAATDYKVDLRTHGRYLSTRLNVDERSDFILSGYDLKAREVSRR
ncbi:hypothetical protein [Pyruvatibacter mobilis]|uniref:hypothetical protein n=1 Tax=Pyruvatibacter mobilis TaxID=1712261 RepID=UPI003BADB97B